MVKRRNYDQKKEIPIARAEDMHYTDPFDEDDWEAQARMKAADHRATKNK